MDQCARWFHTRVSRALEAVPPPTQKAGRRTGPKTPTDSDRCPVSGIRVSRLPEWIAQIVYDDGSAVFFGGSRSLFRFLLAPRSATPGRSRPAVAGIFVTSYFDREPIDASSAFFVVGGDVPGPTGAELVPHRTLAAAQVFRRHHRGTAVVGFDEVTPGLIAGLDEV